MTTLASDDFTDTTGTELSAHTPTGGGSWTKSIGAGGDLIKITGNAAYPNCAVAWAVYYHSATPASAAYDVSLTNVAAGAGSAIGPCGRVSTSADTYYFAWPTTGVITLYKAVAGAFTSLGTYGASSAGDTLKLQITDATKKVFVNGTERISSADNSITATGKAGLRAYGNSTGVTFDGWLAEETAGAAFMFHPFTPVLQAVNRSGTY
jgi:hypothetical protein